MAATIAPKIDSSPVLLRSGTMKPRRPGRTSGLGLRGSIVPWLQETLLSKSSITVGDTWLNGTAR